MDEDFPPVVPGTRILVQLRDRSYVDIGGNRRFLQAPPVEMTVLDRDVCQHAETICLECIPEWAQDHYIVLRGEQDG